MLPVLVLAPASKFTDAGAKELEAGAGRTRACASPRPLLAPATPALVHARALKRIRIFVSVLVLVGALSLVAQGALACKRLSEALSKLRAHKAFSLLQSR